MSVQAERPLRADAERNRRRILDAARELFAERGLDVSMDEIAAAAGVGVGTAYRRVRNREELVEAMFDDQMAAMEARARAALEHPDPWAGFAGFFEQTVRAQAESRGLKQLLFSSAEGREKLHRMRARTLPIVAQVVERAKEAGDLREDFEPGDVPVLAFMVGAVIDFTGPVEPELWERYLALLLGSLRSGATAPLPRRALDQAQLEAAMECWRPGKRC